MTVHVYIVRLSNLLALFALCHGGGKNVLLNPKRAVEFAKRSAKITIEICKSIVKSLTHSKGI
jgi:hypothetical protein